MVTATLYIEGGGEGKDLRARFREGWKKFFDSASVGGRTKIVRGAGRRQTFDRFATAVSDSSPARSPSSSWTAKVRLCRDTRSGSTCTPVTVGPGPKARATIGHS